MKKLKTNKGITMISLVVTIILLIILSSIVTYSGLSSIRNNKFEKLKFELEMVQANVNLWYEQYKNLSSDEIISSIKDVPTFEVEDNTSLIDMLVNNKIVSSKREAREMISGNAISINNKKETDLEKIITKSDAIDEKVLLIKKGKKNYFLGLMK